MRGRKLSWEDERGSVLVMVALWLPVVVVMLTFVIDTGNWFEHKRHLQLQADAAAFAGGGLFNGCFGDSTAASAAIDAEARKYAGDPGAPAQYNLQLGGSKKGAVTVLINKKTFQVGGPAADDTVESDACSAKMVDVKITEAGLPWFIGGNLVPSINAHARVELQQKGRQSGSLPVGVPDNNPLAAAAIFVDESDNNTVLAKESLTQVGTVTLNGQSLVQWSSASTPVNISHANNSVVVALAGQAGWTPTGATLSAICNNILVECYQGGDLGPWTGLDFIHGYPTAGTGTPLAPIVRDTTLYKVGCTDDSGPYFLLNAGCTVGVRAKIDFGFTGLDPSAAPPLGIGAQVKVDGWGCPNGGQNPKGCNMVYNTAGADAGYWTTGATGGYPTMPADPGAHRIDLNWKTASSAAQTLTAVHRSFSASSETAGPVQYVAVSELTPGANSLPFGSHNLSVTIGVKPSVQTNSQSPTAAPVFLKVVGGSQNQAIDCDPGQGTNLRYELANGCSPNYTINKGAPCEPYSYYVFPQTKDWDCTRTQTGGQNGQVYQGMLDRTQGGLNSCINPIHWVDSNGDGKITVPEDIPLGDPRIMPVFVTPFGSFSGSGNAVVPITNFASFYVTGFSQSGGPGQGDPCPGADAVPAGGGYIVGHFIKYVDTVGGSGSGQLCDFNSFGTCVAVLTK